MTKDLVKVEGTDQYKTQLGHEVSWISESNYLFNFSDSIKSKVYDWITGPTNPIKPDYIKNQVLADLASLKPQISISRPRSRINWGIQVPDDPDQTIYVWLDALVNYITTYPTNSEHPDENYEMLHILGKDITKFHCIYWPAFLHAAGHTMPQELI